MRIEIFFVPGCPNYEPAVERLKKVLASESFRVDVEGVPVNSDEDARALMFPGSPTIRINGNDVEQEQISTYGLNCRLYANRTGIPSEDSLRRAVSKATAVEQQ